MYSISRPSPNELRTTDLRRDITIDRLQLSCGCIVAKLDPHVIATNETAILTLELASRIGGNQTGVGSLVLPATLDSVQIPISWTVWHDLVVDKDPISFGQVEPVGNTTIEFLVSHSRDAGTRSTPMGLKVSANPSSILEANVFENRVRLPLKDPSKEMQQSGVLLISDSQMDEGQSVQFPIYWNVKKQPVIAAPKIIFAKAGKSSKASTQIVSIGRELGEVKSVSSTLEISNWKVVRRSDSALRVDFEIAAPAAQTGSATVRIEFDSVNNSNSAHFVTIPVSVQ